MAETKKIRMLVGMAGIDYSHSPGQEIEVDAGSAKRLVDSGQAEYVSEPRKREAATRQTREKAVQSKAATRSKPARKPRAKKSAKSGKK